MADGSADSVADAAAKILPILLVNELREQCSVPRICLTDEQILGLLNARAKAADADTLTATAEYIAPLAVAEWNKHREDVSGTRTRLSVEAKEEDEKRNKEALAASSRMSRMIPAKNRGVVKSKGVALADASLVTVRGLVPLPPSSLCDATSLVREVGLLLIDYRAAIGQRRVHVDVAGCRIRVLDAVDQQVDGRLGQILIGRAQYGSAGGSWAWQSR